MKKKNQKSMTIDAATWDAYVKTLRGIDNRAAEEMIQWMAKKHGFIQEFNAYMLTGAQREELITMAHALATKYGEAASAAACEMYDAVARKSRATKAKRAIPAKTASRKETAKAVMGAAKQGGAMIPGVVSRLVRTAGADTMMQNAIRDGAEWAWIPGGDSCAFCLTLASQGWMPASQEQMSGGHADHIHNNCNCTFAIRFNSETNVAGYDPQKYLDMFQNRPGSWTDKINAVRRENYAENADQINAQKREAYAARKAAEEASAEPK